MSDRSGRGGVFHGTWVWCLRGGGQTAIAFHDILSAAHGRISDSRREIGRQVVASLPFRSTSGCKFFEESTGRPYTGHVIVISLDVVPSSTTRMDTAEPKERVKREEKSVKYTRALYPSRSGNREPLA